LSSDYVDVQVINTLASFFAIIDDYPVPCGVQSLLFGNLSNSDHEVSEHGLMGLIGLAKLREALSILWND
jgi:hypothetical protein